MDLASRSCSSSSTRIDPNRSKEVHVFGFSYLWHGLHEMIEHLAKNSDVHIYTLAPFIEFEDDRASLGPESPAGPTLTRRGVRASSMTRRGDANPADLPIVAQWGLPGREYFRMLDQIVRQPRISRPTLCSANPPRSWAVFSARF